MTALWASLSPGEQYAVVLIPTFVLAMLIAAGAGSLLALFERSE